MAAAQAPAAKPADAPAARSRVGANCRNDQSSPTKIGMASVSTDQGQIIQLWPRHIASQLAEGVLASSPMPIPIKMSTGMSRTQRPLKEPEVGLASWATI